MMRFCKACQRQRPLHHFDLSAEVLQSVCRVCALKPTPADVARDRAELRERKALQDQIAELEDRRRGLIAALVRIDAEIAALRAGPPATPVAADADDVFS